MSEDNGFSVEILHIGWVNMYAPFYLNVMRYREKGVRLVKNSGSGSDVEINADNNFFCKAEKSFKIRDTKPLLTSFQGKKLEEIRFIKVDTDDDIIKMLTDNQAEQNIFRIALCEPVFLGKPESDQNKFEWDIFINRLLLWGLADLALLKKYKLLESRDIVSRLFQTNISTSLETIKDNLNKLKGTQKQLHVYSYKEGTTIYKKVQNIFKKEEVKDYVKFIEANLEEIYEPLGHIDPTSNKKDQNPWIIFTAEPTKAFKKYNINRHEDIGFISSSTARTVDFTALICKSEQLETRKEFRKFFYSFKEKLQNTIENFYKSPSFKSIASNKEEQFDLLEWEIYRNQRIYTFDIKKEAEKWKTVFDGIATKIQNQAEQDNQSEIFRVKEYEPKNLRDDEKNFIDTIAIGQESKISGDDDLKSTAFFVLGVLSRLHNAQQLASKKSAIAAIISRNMSHNLGSHVINYLKHFVDILGMSLCVGTKKNLELFKFDTKYLQTMVEEENIDKDFSERIVWRTGGAGQASFLEESLYRFLEYLNRRMEFIATMTTSVPSTPLVMNFDSEIWKPMVHENSFLVDFIAKSDLDAKMKLSLNWRLSKSSKDKKNLEIAIPDGVVGCHALYTIIENFIRNSAKHGSQGSEEDKLEITIDISEYNDDYFEVKIFDNLKNGGDLIKILNNLQLQEQKDVQKSGKHQKPFIQFEERKHNDLSEFHVLNPRLIDKTGNLIHQMWGIKEMFIGACFLRGFTLEEYNLKHDELPALSVGTDKNGNLIYNFYITKPKFLLTLSQSDCKDFEHFKEETFKDRGVDLLDYGTFEKGKYFIRHRFCLLHMCPSKELGACEVNNGKSRCVDEYNNWISRNENLLPYRIFCDCKYIPKDRDWVKWKKEWTTNIEDFDCLKERLYSEWIKKFYKLKELPSLIIIDPKTDQATWKTEAKFPDLSASRDKSVDKLKAFFNEDKPESAVIFWFHFMKNSGTKEYLKARKEINKNCSKVAWEDLSGGNATNHLIREVNNSSDIRLRKYEIIEACLASVVIIDERIYNNCDADLYNFNWDWRDVRVYNFAIKKDEIDGDKTKKYFISKYSRKIDWIDLDNGYDFLKNGKNEKTDFLVIHRGIIEKILETEKEEVVDGLFANLMSVARFIIVDSGRGKPDYISKSRYVRFINLENLYQWFFDCKISLVRGLFSLINREGV